MAGAQFYFEKVRDRQVWDFPLVNVAAAIKPNGGNIGEARLVVNAVAATPRRLKSVEAAIVGRPRNEETAKMAGDMAVSGAETPRHNGYKLPLMRNLVKRAIRGVPRNVDDLNPDASVTAAHREGGTESPVYGSPRIPRGQISSE
jgi:xanthine dehydrogenase YagS FAD-binding subunit